MKQVAINDEEAKQAAHRVKLRQETGIEPDSINKGLKEIRRVANALEVLVQSPEKGASQGLDVFGMFVHGIMRNISDLRDNLIRALWARYVRCIPLNVVIGGNLDVSDFVIQMDQKVGTGDFDAQVMEDQIIGMIPNFNKIALANILHTVRVMLPTTKGMGEDNMLVGNRLTLDTTKGESYGDGIDAIGKLSRIVLLGEEAATARSCKRKPTSPHSDTDPILMVGGEPIVSVSCCSVGYGLMVVEYETPEKASRVADALLTWGENEHEASQDQ